MFYSEDGSVVGKLNKENKEFIGNYIAECWDIKLKINDDRKLVIRSSALQNIQMIALFIRGWFTDGQAENEYDRALYRLLNEETNQTLDQSLIRKAMDNEVGDVRIEDTDGEDEPVAQEEEADEGEGDERKPEKVLLCGRIYKSNGNWYYERYNYSFLEEKFPNFIEDIGKIEVQSRDYI